MPIIRTLADIYNFPGGPTPAEEALLVACAAGHWCELGDGELPPEDAGSDRLIRADVLRYLILGGCDACRVEGWGVRLAGARVTGRLDLSFQTARGATGLLFCHFDKGIEALQAKLAALNLNGSILPALNAQGAEVEGDVFLRDVTATGEVGLSGAIIRGQLACDGSEFANESGHALNAQAAEVKGGVFLDAVTTTGEITLAGAIIGGELRCERAKVTNGNGYALNAQGAEVKGDVILSKVTAMGEVSLSRAIIGGQLACEGAKLSNEHRCALNAQTATIRGDLIWRDAATCQAGVMDLTATKTADLVDDLSCWPDDGRLILNGFTYEQIYGDLNVAARLRWLENGSLHENVFDTQPYSQLAKFYARRGRKNDANKVRLAREKLERKTARDRWARAHSSDWTRFITRSLKLAWWSVRCCWDWILWAFAGYGISYFRAVLWLIPLWLLATLLAHLAWEAGDFAPNSDVIQTTEAWRAWAQPAMGPPVANPAQVWSDRHAPGADWETFNRYAYAADLVIPIIDLNQTDVWTPSTNRGPWGRWLWQSGFLFSIAGWFITALGAAALTGVIQKERD